jgi:beta-glucan synthesis-associated protein KRE6
MTASSPMSSASSSLEDPSSTWLVECINTQTISAKYSLVPWDVLLKYPNDVEKDDWLHNPDPDEKDGGWCEGFYSGRGIWNCIGLAVIGLLMVGLLAGGPLM